MGLLEVVVYVAGGLILVMIGLIGYLLTQKDQDNKANFDELYEKIDFLTNKLDLKYEGFVRATTTGFDQLKNVMGDLTKEAILDRSKLEGYNKNCDKMTEMVSKRLNSHAREIKEIRKIVAEHDFIIKTKFDKNEQ
jgi:UDP-2,3-diacylglucosamine pyrophosphatase LpxH